MRIFGPQLQLQLLARDAAGKTRSAIATYLQQNARRELEDRLKQRHLPDGQRSGAPVRRADRDYQPPALRRGTAGDNGYQFIPAASSGSTQADQQLSAVPDRLCLCVACLSEWNGWALLKLRPRPMKVSHPRQCSAAVGRTFYMVELVGIEPTTSSLRTMRSPS